MGVELSLAKSAIRISLGKQNTETEISVFLTVLKKLLGIP
jgi:cysteine desulfurase